MLAIELANCAGIIKSIRVPIDLYNEYIGKTSSLLAILLQRNLEEDIDWKDSSKWVDDCLISKFLINKDNMQLGGLMIWGAGGTTEQWCDPFKFEGEINPNNQELSSYTFYFGDEDNQIKSYDNYRHKRDIWNNFNGNWAYIVSEG